jgi:DNA modification methylase
VDVNQVLQGDCLELMRSLEDNSIDAIVAAPPAGISFMGKHWDSDKGERKYTMKTNTLAPDQILAILPSYDLNEPGLCISDWNTATIETLRLMVEEGAAIVERTYGTYYFWRAGK